MKFFFKFRMFAALAVALMLAGTKTEAQSSGSFGLSVSNSASSLLVSNSLTYTITVTNLLGVLDDAVVSNTLPTSVQLLSANPSLGGIVTNFGSVVIFDMGGLDFGAVAQMTLTVKPTVTGFLTNMVVVSTIDVTNTAATNVVVQVTNIVINADLGVAITVPTTAIITNDFMAYGVSVTNAGPNDAPNVMLTNTLPPGVILKGVSPTKPSFTTVSSNMIFNLGTLKNGAFTNFQIAIQPTNADVLNFFALVGATGVIDANTNNNSASNSITVINYLPGQLMASITSTQLYNPQNGLVEQTINLSNTGTNDVPAARVVVTGLLTNQLFNASGTNNGNPFVVYSSALGTNQSVSLLLQFFALNYFSFSNSQMQAFAVPVPDLTPPKASSASTNLDITRIVRLSNGNMLIEFPSLTNRTYTVVYSDNVSFSNAMIAPPSIVAGANRKQWIDYGPPATVSAPTNSNTRFYRVFLNP
ncbi:MAG TPA: hypothetical protein VHY30_08280 [Verrucomicrobiae bacterium]|jgi:uncharacterized repeat protein (TIGR01451 family)|nr:hypothetical protein [Verrucomicrobiae bacterium]